MGNNSSSVNSNTSSFDYSLHEYSTTTESKSIVGIENVYPSVVTNELSSVADEKQWLQIHVDPIKHILNQEEIKTLIISLIEHDQPEQLEWTMKHLQWNLFIPVVLKDGWQSVPCYNHLLHRRSCAASNIRVFKGQPWIEKDPEFTFKLVQYLLIHRSVYLFTHVDLHWIGVCSASARRGKWSIDEYNLYRLCIIFALHTRLNELFVVILRQYLECVIWKERMVWYWMIVNQTLNNKHIADQFTAHVLRENHIAPDSEICRYIIQYHMKESFEVVVAQKYVFEVKHSMSCIEYPPYVFLPCTTPESLFLRLYENDASWKAFDHHPTLYITMVREAVKRDFLQLIALLITSKQSYFGKYIVQSDTLLTIDILRLNSSLYLPLLYQALQSQRLNAVAQSQENTYDEQVFKLLKLLVLRNELRLVKEICTNVILRQIHIQTLITDYATGDMKVLLQQFITCSSVV